MKCFKPIAVAMLITSSTCCVESRAFAADGWQEATFPAPNGGRLVFIILSDGNPACASYDGRNCLWGQSRGDIEFARIKPLACGAAHRKLYGSTGFEDPKHWCNLALAQHTTQTAPVTPSPQAGGQRMTDWSERVRAGGLTYRYRVAWDPSGPGKKVEIIYEVQNSGAQQWSGLARLLCAGETIAQKDVKVAPGRIETVHVNGKNCGNASNPDIRPMIVQDKIP